MSPTLRDTPARHALIAEAVPTLDNLTRTTARKRGLGPQAAEELWSAGSLRLTQAAAKFDESRGVPWLAYATQEIRYGFRDAAKENARGTRMASLDADANGEGASLACLMPDPRASDPGELAAARECLTPTRPGGRSRNPLPDPLAIVEKAQALHAAVYAAVSVEDMTDVMAVLVAKAKTGHHSSMKTLIDMVNPRATGIKVVVHKAYVQPEDCS